ncbi:Chorion peroxidase [Sarcoptes scabiei]|uniref:Chorion peroxidase n=1 Tax=Sarcoptes scabiei TaxID=52283 RepID=A0A834RKG3_SARSC|nr:Chorion peroxidase [Sarcoptes scabiei]
MKIGFISLEDINVAAKEANRFVENYVEQERQLVQHGMIQRHGSMQSLHQAFFGDFDPVQFKLTVGGFINLITTIVIKKKFNLNNEQARDGLYKYSIENTDLEKYCIPEPTCHQGKYRTIDGSCNNLQRPLWGKSNTAFERLLPPHYDDGLHEPRTKSVVQGNLPSARWVSQECAKSRNLPDPQYTLMVMQWGQFIDHDLTLAASTRAATGQGLICCHPETQKKIEHHACFPIEIPNNDPFYSRHNQRCMHLVRNSPAPRSGCSLGHREQMNTLSHIIDGSMVYGSTQERAKLLRTFRGGKMKASLIRNQEFLPFDRGNHSDDCAIPERDQRQFKCFLGGDVRVNEQTGLTMIHALMIREHNRIADELARFNPDWSDTNLFQEARRIVAAEIQHITYNEWLPIIISPTVMKQFGLLPKTFEHTYSYDTRTNPNILNEFATAAYRLHSLVQGTFRALNDNGQPTQTIQLHQIFNNPLALYSPNAFENLLNGFTTDPAQSWDSFFTKDLTERLFQESGSAFGMDLVALNIQRGRDHGLPGLNHFRRICGLRPARSFNELNEFMESGSSEAFARVYKHVDDIDLFIGGVHEVPLPDALVGPTFACIIGEQFRRLKYGDRFWYEVGKLPHSFSENQLMEIRKSSMAGLICANTNTISRVQPLAFLRPEGWNIKIDCSKIAKMNLQHWRNEKIWS